MLHCLVVVVLVPIRKFAWWHSSPFESTITREDLILQGHCKIETWIKSQLTVITRVCATYGWSSRSTRVGNSKDIRYTLSNIITLLEEWFSKQSFGISHSASKVTVVSSVNNYSMYSCFCSISKQRFKEKCEQYCFSHVLVIDFCCRLYYGLYNSLLLIKSQI